MPFFADFEREKWSWITAFDKKFYPDHFAEALNHYEPFIEKFRELCKKAKDSKDLLKLIHEVSNPPRIQLLRIFSRYVCPITSVEMLKKKGAIEEICIAFGPMFRNIQLVRANINETSNDGILAALLFEHKERGKFGYELTEKFFQWFESIFSMPEFEALGPRRAGKDIELSEVIPAYQHRCPTDILITHRGEPIVAGFARYDSDRGGAQEDDRTGGNRSKILEIIEHKNEKGMPLKILFLNDGPGLLLGSMWRDYAELEQINPNRILVATMKMLPARLTREWLLSS